MTLKQKFKFLIFLCLGIGAIFFFKNFSWNPQQEIPQEEEKIKNTPVIKFNHWSPKDQRTVLAVVESEQEISVLAEVAGTVERTFVQIGDRVKKGALLASFQKADDLTQINFENAIRTLETTKISAQNSVASAEITLQNAQEELKQKIRTEAQSHKQAFDTLKTSAQNAETTISNILNFVDRALGASNKYRYEVYAGRYELGAKNTIKKNDTKNLIVELRREFDALGYSMGYDLSEDQILLFAQDRLDLAKDLQQALLWYDDLVRDSILSQSFSESARQQIQTTTEGHLTQLNSITLALETQIESAKSVSENSNLAILAAENGVKKAESSLKLAQASAQSQIAGAQSQYKLAQSSQKDLKITAPFGGKVLERNIQTSDRISPGQKLFVLVNENAPKKVVAFLNLEEWEIVKNQESLSVELSNETVFEAKKKFLSSRLDPQTQKIRVEILIDQNAVAQDILVGSFAKLRLPLGQSQKNLIPISAISFEPDGAEVLVINNENQTERRKVSFGKIISDAIAILDGLSDGELLVQFYNRSAANQKVKTILTP